MDTVGILQTLVIKIRRSMNANEHYVSQVLLRRFTIAGHLQCYRVREDKWRRASPKNVLSEDGYNQLLVGGQVDNTLEQAFSKVETLLPKTFEALEEAVSKSSTELPQDVYENLCWYCAFIKRVSPFAKAAAPADFIIQLDKELEHGRPDTLRDVLNFPEEVVQFYRREHALGRKVIIYSQNFLQLVYRIQFRRKYGFDYSTFRHNTKWTICKSPIELPIADVAMTEFRSRHTTPFIMAFQLAEISCSRGKSLGENKSARFKQSSKGLLLAWKRLSFGSKRFVYRRSLNLYPHKESLTY